MKMMTGALVAIFLATAAPAVALEPLSQERYINDRLVAARVADRIRRECDSIDARMVYAWSQLRALINYAKDKGYSQAQIDAFMDSKPDKKRIYSIAETYLAQQGARDGNAESFCAVGRNEIAMRTVTGSLLNAK